MASGNIAAAAGANRDQAIFSGVARLIELPFSLLDVSIMVEIRFGEPVRGLVGWSFTRRKSPVVVLVILRKNRGEVRNFSVLLLIAADFPSVDEDAISVDERHGLQLPGHAAHPPQFLAGVDGIGRHFEGPRNNQ